jgi:hypothetical protein
MLKLGVINLIVTCIFLYFSEPGMSSTEQLVWRSNLQRIYVGKPVRKCSLGRSKSRRQAFTVSLEAVDSSEILVPIYPARGHTVA